MKFSSHGALSAAGVHGCDLFSITAFVLQFGYIPVDGYETG